MAEENSAAEVVAEPRFRGRIGPAVGSLTEKVNKLMADIENIEKQWQALRRAFDELKSNIG